MPEAGMSPPTALGSLTVAVIAVPSTGEPLIATDKVSVGLSATAAEAALVPVSALLAASVNEAVTVSAWPSSASVGVPFLGNAGGRHVAAHRIGVAHRRGDRRAFNRRAVDRDRQSLGRALRNRAQNHRRALAAGRIRGIGRHQLERVPLIGFGR